jgi:hypothetical protein
MGKKRRAQKARAKARAKCAGVAASHKDAPNPGEVASCWLLAPLGYRTPSYGTDPLLRPARAQRRVKGATRRRDPSVGRSDKSFDRALEEGRIDRPEVIHPNAGLPLGAAGGWLPRDVAPKAPPTAAERRQLNEWNEMTPEARAQGIAEFDGAVPALPNSVRRSTDRGRGHTTETWRKHRQSAQSGEFKKSDKASKKRKAS